MKTLSFFFALILILFLLIVLPGHLPEKTDVVIIGAGAAGMRAAIESQRHTDRVVLLEKMPYPGGNSHKATAGFNAVTEESDMDDYIRDTREAGAYLGKPELIALLAAKSAEALYDLREMGADLEDRGLLAGHSRSRTYRPSGGSPVGVEVTSVLNHAIERRGIDMRLENRALLVERKKKWRVRVANRTGREYTIRADAVIIATGGFGGNPRLVAAYNPRLKGFHTTNQTSTSGDYIGLTEKLPVQLIDMDKIQTHPTVEPEFSTLITEALRGNGGILVNYRGERFTDEMAFREDLSRRILEQRYGFAWLIFDQNVREGLRASEYYIRNQLTHSGNDPEELAEKLSLPAGTLAPALDRWNRFVREGFDEDFARSDLKVPLDHSPYYGIRVTPGIHYCMGGLAINGKAQVLDREGIPLPGLYAAGEATGGIHGEDRLGGNSLTDALVFGKIAGYEAGRFSLYKEEGNP